MLCLSTMEKKNHTFKRFKNKREIMKKGDRKKKKDKSELKKKKKKQVE